MTDIVDRLRHHAKVGDGWTRPVASEAAAEIERMRKALREIAIGRPDIPEGEDGEGPDWPMHVFALVWARYCTELQTIARDALGETKP